MPTSYNSFVYDLSVKSGEITQAKNITLNFGIFFDGTCNNMWDTQARKIFEEKYGKTGDNIVDKKIYKKNTAEYKKKDKTREELAAEAYAKYSEDTDDSYENDYSNVARLYQNKIAPQYAIYIEGAGTTSKEVEEGIINYGDNDSGGLGFGHGTSGIRMKVRSACEKAAIMIVDMLSTNKSGSLHRIVFDVYGFSRGAATARNFIHEVTTVGGIESLASNVDKQKYYIKRTKRGTIVPPRGFLGFYLRQQGIDLATQQVDIEIRVAGLFDTVSSYEPKGATGIAGAALSHNFNNDVEELNLRAVAKANRVLHLTAMDEHRQNFSLTTIRSALDGAASPSEGKIALEIAMPGVHSDVGGCYYDNMTETVEVLNEKNPLPEKKIMRKLDLDCENLVDQGWFFFSNRVTDHNWDVPSKLKFTRKGIRNIYSYIPLHLMARYIVEKWETTWIQFSQSSEEKPVIKMDTIKEDFPLPQDPLYSFHFFTVTGDIIHFQAGYLTCKIYKEKNAPLSTTYQCWDDMEVTHWIVEGAGSSRRYVRWTECVEHLINYIRWNLFLIVPGISEDPLRFAMRYYLSNPLPDKKYVYPAFIKGLVDLSSYAYNTNFTTQTSEREAFDRFKSNLPAFNKSLEEQIYLRRLRNIYLHWSSNYKINAVVTSSNLPNKREEGGIVIRERCIIEG